MRNKARLHPEMKQRMQELRRNATDAEKLLWERLRSRRLMNMKFRRQHPIHGYVLDFYCDEAKLGIELDGSEHNGAEQAQCDMERSRILAEQEGIAIIRFWNSEVMKQTEYVLSKLERILTRRLSLNSSPFSRWEKGRG